MKTIVIIFVLISCVTVLSNMLAGCSSGDKTTSDDNESGFYNVTAAEAHKIIQDNKADDSFAILDVRTSGEFSSGHIEGAINIDFYGASFNDSLGKLDRDKTYMVYCHSGNRSVQTLATMKSQAFNAAYNMLGGIGKWKAQGLLVVE
ncbi:rhodanese-like domain-containing protein [Candidatus Latescibacterota bacterium]